MFILFADKNQLTSKKREPLTSGSVNVYEARFEFSPDWDKLIKTAVFKSGSQSVSVLLDETNTCTIPWEVQVKPGAQLMVGVYGTRDGETVLPTIWASLGTILEGTTAGQDAQPPTPDLWEQGLGRKGDKLDYTPDGDLGLYAGDKLLSAVPIQGGGEGGTTDHRLLTGRDAEKQHPILSIDGLIGELERIPAPAEPITNLELEELLK